MNTPSPLVPQGTSPDRGKSSLHFKILMILTLHVVLIGGMLLQGCKDTKSTPAADVTAANDQTNTTAPDLTALPPVNTNIPPAMTPAPATSSYSATPMPAPGTNPMANNGLNSSPVVAPPMAAPAAPTAPETKEYIVARGDILANIAKKNGVSLKALMAANPGIEPRKLKIGAKLQLPDSATSSTVAATGAPGATETGDTALYTVKAGDMLGRIAKAHGTTVSKIKALNDLKTTSIKVGQKLKLPGGKGGSEASTAASAPSASVAAPSALYAAAPQPTGATR